jgi:hypothetical protein
VEISLQCTSFCQIGAGRAGPVFWVGGDFRSPNDNLVKPKNYESKIKNCFFGHFKCQDFQALEN